MKILLQRGLIALILVIQINGIYANKYSIHGVVRDAENGESLIGANVFVKANGVGVVTNTYGFYSVGLPEGKYEIEYSYLGYKSQVKVVDLNKDISLNIELIPETESIEEVVIKAEKKNHNVTSTKIGVQKLESKTIQQIPVMFGEADVIKAIKLLPGVATTSETSSNISVRGGARDQNLILLDEATVYSASHMLGLFSVFNNDAVRNVEFYKGIMPANYGGRISSVIDVRMKDGNTKQFKGAGNVGLLSTKLTLEGPIVKDKAGFMVSGRRTYFDLITKMASKKNGQVQEVPYFFYDLNAKANWKINDKNRIYLSGYFGKDKMNMDIDEDNRSSNEWGNYTGTLRWNYIINKRLFLNTTVLASRYNFSIWGLNRYGKQKKELEFNWDAFMKDYSLKTDFGYFVNNKNTLGFGALATYHDFSSGKVDGRNDTVKFNFRIPKYYAAEYAVYITNKHKVSSWLTMEYGVRATAFHNMGPSTEYKIENDEVTGSKEHAKNHIYNEYYGLEPRFSSSFLIDEKQSIKLGYARTMQYLQVASNSVGVTPIDVWMPATNNIKPQIGDQVALGYFRNFFDNQLETSIEVYYKYMQNQVEFKEFSQPFLNPEIEEEFRFGTAQSYGTEFYIKKPAGKFNGWISYTLSRSMRKTDNFWEKDWYLSPYDVPHNLSVFGTYSILPRLNVSANWVFTSGKPFDSPSARFEYEGSVVTYYDKKHNDRYPSYRRLDLGLELKGKPHKKFQTSWTFSVYNALNRKNANIIYFDKDEDNEYITKAYRYSILPRFISVAFNFNF